LFCQSNFGIVTKMGFWLLPEQQAARNYVIEVPLYENVTPFLEVMAHLVCSRIHY
jgi:4-cresol dehydrogenase (hydroxylating)